MGVKKTKKAGATGIPAKGCNECQFFFQGSTNCAGCPETIAVRSILGVAGKNTIVVNATSCLEIVSSQYPSTSWGVNYIHGAFENAAAIAGGVSLALEKMGKAGNVIAIAGDGGTLDIGLQALSGMLERGEKVCYVCLDNEAYMNCLSTSSLIMTKSGLRKITDIKVGDEIAAFSQNSHKLVYKKCTGVFDNGVRDVYELKTRHHSIKATSNHPFLVLNRSGRGVKSNFVWKTLEEIKIGDEIVTLKNVEATGSREFVFRKAEKGDYKVNKINPVEIPNRSSPEIMKYLGIFVGDGWTRDERAEVGFALPEGSEERNAFMDLHSSLFGCETTHDGMYVYARSVNLARFISSLGFGKGAKNKTIPEWVFAVPASEREAFIDGLMLSDGYKYNGSWRYTSSSMELLRRLRLLAQITGFQVGKIHWRKIKKGSKCVKRTLLKDTEAGYICMSKRREPDFKKWPSQTRYRNFFADNPDFDIERVIDVTLIGEEPTLDLRVEDEHNFIADGIVVHNTGVQRSGATPFAASTTTSPAGSVIPGNKTWKKPIVEIVAAHHIPYVATASIGYIEDLKAKVAKALRKENQPAFLHVLNPCPLGWKFDTWRTVEMGRLAVETGMWILFEIENGKTRITKPVEKRKPVEEYLQAQGRFAHLFKPENRHIIKQIQERVDREWDRTSKLCSE